MSIPAKTLYDTCVVNVVNDFKTKFVAAATRGTTGHPQGAILVQSMTGWMDEAGKEVCAAALTLTVPVAGAPAQNTQFQAPAQLQAPSPFASSPFAAQLQPQQQQFAPPPFGGQQQFGQQQQQQQQAPQAGALKGVVSTLAECGIPGQTTRVPSNMMLPQGATCGMQCSKKGHTDIFYCSQPAKKPNPNTGTYCCTSHHSRQGGLDKDPGKKKSGKTSGGNIISAAQIQGLGRPTALPPGMGNNKWLRLWVRIRSSRIILCRISHSIPNSKVNLEINRLILNSRISSDSSHSIPSNSRISLSIRNRALNLSIMCKDKSLEFLNNSNSHRMEAESI